MTGEGRAFLDAAPSLDAMDGQHAAGSARRLQAHADELERMPESSGSAPRDNGTEYVPLPTRAPDGRAPNFPAR